MKHLDAKILTGHSLPIRGVGFSPDGNVLATASEDMTLQLWTTCRWESLRKFVGRAPYSRVAFSACSRFVAASQMSAVDSIVIYDLFSGQSIAHFHIADICEDRPITNITFGNDGCEIACVIGEEFCDRSRFLRWSRTTGSLLGETSLDEMDTGMWFDEAGHFCMETYSLANVRRYYVRRQDGPVVADIDLRGFAAGGVPFSSNDRKLVVLGNWCFSSGVQVLESPTGKLLYARDGDRDGTPLVAISPCNELLGTVISKLRGGDSEVSIVRISDGLQMWTSTAIKQVDRVQFSPDGKFLVVLSLDGWYAYFHDVADGIIRCVVPQKSRSSCFSPDSRWFVSFGESLRVTDMASLTLGANE